MCFSLSCIPWKMSPFRNFTTKKNPMINYGKSLFFFLRFTRYISTLKTPIWKYTPMQRSVYFCIVQCFPNLSWGASTLWNYPQRSRRYCNIRDKTNSVWDILWLWWIKVFREYMEDSNISSMLPKCGGQFIRMKIAATAMVGVRNNGHA